MKDPLQKEQTPYEVLGVGRAVAQPEIFAAFKAAMLARKHDVQVLMGARKVLENPNERALLDLLQYDDEVLSRLSPDPRQDNVLDPDRRLATATAWLAQLTQAFPDSALIRVLGVFYYWWAIHEEERMVALLGAAGERPFGAEGRAPVFPGEISRKAVLDLIRRRQGCDGVEPCACPNRECAWGEDCRVPAPELETLWKAVIACWVVVAANLKTGAESNGGGGTRSADAELAARLIALLQTDFHNLGGRYRVDGFPQLAAQYADLELRLAMEQRVAGFMANADLRIRSAKVVCGSLMLGMVNLLDAAREHVRKRIEARPAEGELRALQSALSPFTAIAVLLENNKPQAAVDLIGRLPEQACASAEVRWLYMRALFLLGQQRLSLGKTHEALDAWGRALQVGVDRALAEEVRRAIITASRERAIVLQQRRRDEAIALLEQALSLVEDQDLQLTLAALLTQRSIEAFNKIMGEARQAKGCYTKAMVDALTKALLDLERAHRMGSNRAGEQLEAARSILNEAREIVSAGMSDMSADVAAYFEQAQEAMSRKDYDSAITTWRSLLRALGRKAPQAIRDRLSQCLANRGVDHANKAVEEFKRNAETHERNKAEKVRWLASRASCGLCANCGRSQYGTPGTWYTVTLAGAHVVLICGFCYSKVTRDLNARPPVSAHVCGLLRSAHADLLEAVRRSPSSQHARENLANVVGIMRTLHVMSRRVQGAVAAVAVAAAAACLVLAGGLLTNPRAESATVGISGNRSTPAMEARSWLNAASWSPESVAKADDLVRQALVKAEYPDLRQLADEIDAEKRAYRMTLASIDSDRALVRLYDGTNAVFENPDRTRTLGAAATPFPALHKRFVLKVFSADHICFDDLMRKGAAGRNRVIRVDASGVSVSKMDVNANDVYALLNTADWTQECLSKARDLTRQAVDAGILGKADSMVKDVEQEVTAYDMRLVAADTERSARIRLGDGKNTTVQPRQVIGDRFIVREILENSLLFEDLKRKGSGGVNRMLRLTRAGVAPK